MGNRNERAGACRWALRQTARREADDALSCGLRAETSRVSWCNCSRRAPRRPPTDS
jgi:hypothetical protein